MLKPADPKSSSKGRGKKMRRSRGLVVTRGALYANAGPDLYEADVIAMYDFLVEKINKGNPIPNEHLEVVLRHSKQVRLPDVLIDYICDRLAGKNRPPRGRKSRGQDVMLRNFFISLLYGTYRSAVNQRDKLAKNPDFAPVAQEEWWSRAPNHEWLARVIARLVSSNDHYGSIDWHQVLNIISKGNVSRKEAQ